MPKCDFKKVAKHWHTLAWAFSYKFATYFQNTFSWEQLWRAASENTTLKNKSCYAVCDVINFNRAFHQLVKNWRFWGSFLLKIKVRHKRKLDSLFFFKEKTTLKHKKNIINHKETSKLTVHLTLKLIKKSWNNQIWFHSKSQLEI